VSTQKEAMILEAKARRRRQTVERSEEARAPGKFRQQRVRILERKICFVSCSRFKKRHWCNLVAGKSHSLKEAIGCNFAAGQKKATVKTSD